MSGSDDLASYLSPSEPTFGFHQGVVKSWNSLTGQNTVLVGGRELTDIPVLTTSDSILLAAGDNVFLMRTKSSFFIMGRVQPAGSTRSLGIKAATAAATGFTASTTFGDLSVGSGPSLDVEIATSRRCLVFVSVFAAADENSEASAHFAVTGASIINPPSGAGSHALGAVLGSSTGGGADVTRVEGSATRMFLLQASDGLNPGTNTFTVKYASSTANDAFFSARTIMVLPF